MGSLISREGSFDKATGQYMRCTLASMGNTWSRIKGYTPHLHHALQLSNGLPNPDRWRSILEAINPVLETQCHTAKRSIVLEHTRARS